LLKEKLTNQIHTTVHVICTPVWSVEQRNIYHLPAVARIMAEAFIVSTEEYHDIFGTSDESDTVNSDGSDINVQEVESVQEEDQNDGESNNDSNVSDTVEWSNQLEDFDIDEFSGQPGIKVNLPDNPSAISLFSQLFGDSVVDSIATETNRYARQKLANSPLLTKWKETTNSEVKAYFGICIIMGLNNLPRIAMYWSTDPFIGNTGIQNVMTWNICLPKTRTHVELFGATGKTCRHVQKVSFAKARKSVLNEAKSYSQMA